MRLRREAAKRETTLDYLVRSVLDVVARDKLTTAILDDGGRTRPSGALLLSLHAAAAPLPADLVPRRGPMPASSHGGPGAGLRLF